MSATEEGGEEQELDSEDMIEAVLELLSKILDAPTPPAHSTAGDSQLLILAILRPFFSSIALLNETHLQNQHKALYAAPNERQNVGVSSGVAAWYQPRRRRLLCLDWRQLQ